MTTRAALIGGGLLALAGAGLLLERGAPGRRAGSDSAARPLGIASRAVGSDDARRDEATLRGSVRTPDGAAAARVFVTARDPKRRMSTTVLTDTEGRFEFPPLRPGPIRIEAHAFGYRPVVLESVSPEDPPDALDLELEREPGADGPMHSSDRLAVLPDGETKRRFILDCTGCHQLGEAFVELDGRPRTRAEWAAAVRKMLSFAGSETSFPIISRGRDPEATADWLVAHLGHGSAGAARGEKRDVTAAHSEATGSGGTGVVQGADSGFVQGADPGVDAAPGAIPDARAVGEGWAATPGKDVLSRAVFTEYSLPQPDLPHDLAIDAEGRAVITGMFTDRMYYLDPGSGDLAQIPIPIPKANPRAVEIDDRGTWWVLLGAASAIARLNPMAGDWDSFEIGLYAHSLARDSSGGLWFNGHFSRDSIDLGRLDSSTGEIRTYRLPPNRDVAGSPIPYELRVGPDGSIWGSELIGNRIFRFWPNTEGSVAYEMPTPNSGPRRLDVAPDGTVWIPAYAAGTLVRFDPRTERFTEHPLPTPDALPYVARVDPRSGVVWVAEAGADAIARFDPASSSWVELPLPTRSALIRHIALDPRTGAVWAAYANAPPVDPKIVRLEIRDR